MKKEVKKAIEEYQCSGCISGHNISCFESSETGVGCGRHYAGTFISYIGKIFLGMPNGFNRLGVGFGQDPIIKTDNFDKYNPDETWAGKENENSFYNMVCWKYLDEKGNTVIRGLMPRLNIIFVQTFNENCLDKFGGIEIPTNEVGQYDFPEPKILTIQIFEKFENKYDKFNMVCWKHLNKNGHTLVRGLKPATNETFLHIYLEDCLDKMDGVEISEEQISKMD